MNWFVQDEKFVGKVFYDRNTKIIETSSLMVTISNFYGYEILTINQCT